MGNSQNMGNSQICEQVMLDTFHGRFSLYPSEYDIENKKFVLSKIIHHLN